jgi:DNA-directed RNA polymerase subunit RPC12/RpoP
MVYACEKCDSLTYSDSAKINYDAETGNTEIRCPECVGGLYKSTGPVEIEIIHLLEESGPMSREELKNEIKENKQTVENAVRHLFEQSHVEATLDGNLRNCASPQDL